MADKKKRVQNLIARNLSDIIIYDLKSELCQLASVNEVRVTNDYSHAKVYVTHLDRERIEPLLKLDLCFHLRWISIKFQNFTLFKTSYMIKALKLILFSIR